MMRAYAVELVHLVCVAVCIGVCVVVAGIARTPL